MSNYFKNLPSLSRLYHLLFFRTTVAHQKLLASLVNVSTVAIISFPAFYIFGFDLRFKLSVLATFFAYETFFGFFKEKRDLGMLVVGSYWHDNVSFLRYCAYNLLYTISFSSMLFYVWFPFDILLFNIIVVQLTCVLITGDTLHGGLTGMRTVVKKYS
ncbi:MAG: hypothetical protein HY931_03170 [Candidatus Falkowbacteria bacterium]|nr:MAG: hypothetical protein HY931_03170 [Candidatus Falkowbacteria bacterium]